MTCDIWTGATTTAGYGIIGRWVDGKRYTFLVHRLVWAQDHGPIPDGMVVMHTCDTPSCIEPTHLRLGTARDNSQDMSVKGRARNQFSGIDVCKHGHREWRERRTGGRYCVACKRGRNRRRAATLSA